MKIHVNNVDLGYDDHGVGLPIIFLHAFPLNREMWQGQMQALLNEGRYRLVALDWRGFGESELAPVTMELLADDIAALMDELGMQQAILCGLSMGGYGAFAFLRKYPQRVQGLVLADTKPTADTEEARAKREQLAQLAEAQGAGAVADQQMTLFLSEETRKQHPQIEQHVRRLIDAAPPAAIAAALRAMAKRSDSSDLLGQISVPTQVIVGEHDALTPPALAREYVTNIPGAQLAIVPRAGHMANLEQPEAFLTVLSTFLRANF